MAGKGRKSNKRNAAAGVSPLQHHLDHDFMDDEIDAFHKQRDVVPLDMNHDEGDSDNDNDHPVYDVKHDSSSEDEDEDEDEDDDDDDDDDDDEVLEKFKKQSRYIQGKIGGAEDETHDDIEEEEDPKKSSVWGRKKDMYYDADNADFEVQTSDDEQLEEEEAEVLRLQQEKTKGLSMEDYGLGEDEGGVEPTFEDILVKGKTVSRSSNKEAQDMTETAYEVVKKDLNALSREEQMDIVYSSAPELVGLLSELNDAVEQLEKKVNPVLSKVREGDGEKKKRVQYLEMKKQLLLSYCQAITFYLLLKSEGRPVRDHPVIARLVEIKSLLDRVKQLDENLPSEVDDILKEEHCSATEVKLSEEDAALKSNGFTNSHNPSVIPSDIQDHVAAELVKVGSLRDDSKGKRKRQDEQLGAQSVEMLKVRAALEEKLKQRGVLGFTASKPAKAKKSLRPINGQLEALDDFDDEAVDVAGSRYGNGDGNVNVLRSNKLSQLVAPRVKKPKVISGDDDLPKRDDIGERRRKHELRVLQGAGMESENDQDDEGGTLESGRFDEVNGGDTETDSDLEFYKQGQQEHAAKVAAKHGKVPRITADSSLHEETSVDGKRSINRQIEKNRGLTRSRNKLTKNPRKKYKLKHKKAVERRKGQVRDVKKPTGPYGGETSGINAGISRSIRLK